MMRGSKEESEIEGLGDAAALQGVRKFSARVKCAMLAWEAVEKCMLKPGCEVQLVLVFGLVGIELYNTQKQTIDQSQQVPE